MKTPTATATNTPSRMRESLMRNKRRFTHSLYVATLLALIATETRPVSSAQTTPSCTATLASILRKRLALQSEIMQLFNTDAHRADSLISLINPAEIKYILAHHTELNEAAEALNIDSITFLERFFSRYPKKEHDGLTKKFFQTVNEYRVANKTISSQQLESIFRSEIPQNLDTLRAEFKKIKLPTEIQNWLNNNPLNTAEDFNFLIKQLSEMPSNKRAKLLQAMHQHHTSVKEHIRQRRIADNKFIRTAATTIALDQLTVLVSHGLLYGLNHLPFLSMDLLTFSILEASLVGVSTKGAARIVAEKTIFREAQAQVLRQHSSGFLASSRSILQSTRESAPFLFSMSYGMTLIPHHITNLTVNTHLSIADALIKSQFDAVMMATFIALWSNIRTQTIIGQIIPYLHNHLLRNAPNSIQVGVDGSLILANIFVGAMSYMIYRDYVYETVDDQFNTIWAKKSISE